MQQNQNQNQKQRNESFQKKRNEKKNQNNRMLLNSHALASSRYLLIAQMIPSFREEEHVYIMGKESLLKKARDLNFDECKWHDILNFL